MWLGQPNQVQIRSIPSGNTYSMLPGHAISPEPRCSLRSCSTRAIPPALQSAAEQNPTTPGKSTVTSWGERLTGSQLLELFRNDYRVWLGFGANCYKISGSPSPLAIQTLKGSESIPNPRHQTLQRCVCKASSSRHCQWVPTQTKNSEHGADGGNVLLPVRRWRWSGTWHRPGSPSLPERHRDSKPLQVQKSHGARVSPQISYVPSKVTIF